MLVSCGSFNPPTNMHLRMLDLAQHALTKVGVWVGLAAGWYTPLLIHSQPELHYCNIYCTSLLCLPGLPLF